MTNKISGLLIKFIINHITYYTVNNVIIELHVWLIINSSI